MVFFFKRTRWWAAMMLVAATAGEARAQLKAVPAELDLGRRGQGQTIESSVVLVNAGDQPLEILGASADCSCTAATPEKTRLGAGERTTLVIKTETRGYQGEIRRRVLVQTSLGEVVVNVKMAVSAFENWSIVPGAVVMAPGGKGQEVAMDVTLTYAGEGPVEIVKFTAEPAWVRATIARRDGKDFVVKVVRLAEAPVGNHTVKVSAETTDKVNGLVTFSVFVPVTSTVGLKPNPIVMPPARAGQPAVFLARLVGWAGEVAPRFELSRGEVKVLGRSEAGLELQIVMTPAEAGVFTQLLRVYAGEQLELEAPVIMRVER